MEEERFHAWQPVLCATIHEVSHGAAELVLESSILEYAPLCREAQAPAHGGERQLAASVPQDIQRLKRFSHRRGPPGLALREVSDAGAGSAQGRRRRGLTPGRAEWQCCSRSDP
jgi:hypothetical protein